MLALAGTLARTQIGVDNSYPYLAGALFLIGADPGATITPSMAAAFQRRHRPRHLAARFLRRALEIGGLGRPQGDHGLTDDSRARA